MITSLWRDFRYALRMLVKTPAVTGIAILALALGIGANTAIFTLVKAILLSPLPYPEPDRIVMVMRDYKGTQIPSVSVLKHDHWMKTSRSFSAMAAFDVLGSGYNLVAAGGDPERITGLRVNGDFFGLVGVRPALGRGFDSDELRPGGSKAVVVSHGLWQRRFGGDPAILGRTLALSGQNYQVIGIMPREFRFAPAAEMWIPLQQPTKSDDVSNYLLCMGRLKAGVSLAAAQAEMTGIANNMRREFPAAMDKEESISLRPAAELLASYARPALLMLLGAVGFVLLIACANVANLLIARAAARKKEVALRIAIGASRWDLMRQMLTESVLLALAGGALGFLLGWTGTRALVGYMPVEIPIFDFAPDGRVFLFTMGVSLFTGLLFGMAPALQAWHTNLNDTLKDSGRVGDSRRRALARRILVAAEMALAVVLVIGASLLIQTLYHLRELDPGFETRNVLTMQMSMSGPRYENPRDSDAFFRRAIQRLEALPGVEAAATVTSLPLELGPDFGYTVQGHEGDFGAQWRTVTPRYFEALRVRLQSGRFFSDNDTGQSTPVVLINQTFAKRHWPTGNAVGQRIVVGRNQNLGDPPRLIVGVVADVREAGLDANAPAIMYLPTSQVPALANRMINAILPVHWVIRTKVDPMTLVAAIKRELKAVDFQQPVANVRTMDQVLVRSLVLRNLSTSLLGIFAGVALLLAAIGVYGVMAYSVTQRTHEIGIRMALGASRTEVLGMILGQGGKVALAGVGVGLAAAFALTRVLGTLLFGVSATNIWTFSGVAALLVGVALFASYIPARRAMRVDPMTALRCE